MKNVLAIYFSGTGNTKYVLEKMRNKLKKESFELFSIEESFDFVNMAAKADTIIVGYPIYGSMLPKIMQEFLNRYKAAFEGKNIISVATQYLFSGDGGALLFRELKGVNFNKKASIHINMPSNLGVKGLIKIKNGKENNKKLLKANNKIFKVCNKLNNGIAIRNGKGFISWFLGFFTQRLWFSMFKSKMTKRIKVDSDCNGCGICNKLCPCNNFEIVENKAQPLGKCTLCYRCINACPKQAIRLLGKVKKQYKGVE